MRGSEKIQSKFLLSFLVGPNIKAEVKHPLERRILVARIFHARENKLPVDGAFIVEPALAAMAGFSGSTSAYRV